MRKLENYQPTKFMAADSTYNKDMADFAVAFMVSTLSLSTGRNRLSVTFLEPSSQTAIDNSTPPTWRFPRRWENQSWLLPWHCS